MKISIIIVTYNSQDTIEECLASCIDQPDCEIIVVDNASIDNTRELVTKYRQVRLIKEEKNLGYNGGNASGIEASNAEILIFLNPDSVLPNGFSNRVVTLFGRDTSLSILGFRMVHSDGSLQRTGNNFPTMRSLLYEHSTYRKVFPKSAAFKRYIIYDWDRSSSREVDAVSGACMGIRRSALEVAGGIDTSYFLFFEEFDLSRKIKGAGSKVYFDAETSVTHQSGSSTKKVVNDVIAKYYRQSRDRYIYKYHGRLFLLCFKILIITFNLVSKPIEILRWFQATPVGKIER